MTLFETGVIDYLRSSRFHFLDRYEKGLTPEQVVQVFKKAFTSDVFFSSSNAVTEDGYLYNVDGNGNRVAPMIYGPDSVVIIVGWNKIVKDIDAAIERNRQISAPANVVRLGIPNPCAKTGHCMDCQGATRICCDYVLLGKQKIPGRIKVLILGEDYGY